MILSLATLAGTLTGEVTYYNPGIMEAVYANRLRWRQVEPCAECVGMVALLDRDHLGRRVWIARPGYPPEGPFLVVDCAGRADRPRLQARGLVAEVDWPTARRWQMTGPLFDVRILFDDERSTWRSSPPFSCGSPASRTPC